MPHADFRLPFADWPPLPDALLRTRLIHRGCDPSEAKALVANRRHRESADTINDYMTSDDYTPMELKPRTRPKQEPAT